MLLLLTVQKGARFSAEGCVGEEVTFWPVLVPTYGRSGLVAAMGYQKLLQKRFPESEDSSLPLQVVETAMVLDRYDSVR